MSNHASRHTVKRGRTTAKKPRPLTATVEYIAPDGHVVKRETVTAEESTPTPEQLRRAQAAARVQAMGLWLPS